MENIYAKDYVSSEWERQRKAREKLSQAEEAQRAEWTKEEEAKNKIKELKSFYYGLMDDLRKGTRPPGEVLQFEELTMPPKEEMETMTEKDWDYVCERNGLADELHEVRKTLERKEIENVVADEVLAKREKDVGRKFESMTEGEKEEYFQRLQEVE